MNKMILKIELHNTKSFYMTFLYVDKRLLSNGKNDDACFGFANEGHDFTIYSNKTIMQGDNFLRLPSKDKYEKNVPHRFNFLCETEMHDWLKMFHRTLFEMNNNYEPFVKDEIYKEKSKKIILDGKYWIV